MSETASAMIDDLSLEPETLGSEIKNKPTPDLDNRMTLIDLTDIKKMSKEEKLAYIDQLKSEIGLCKQKEQKHDKNWKDYKELKIKMGSNQ